MCRMLQNKTEARVATKSAQDKAERIRNQGFQAAGKNGSRQVLLEAYAQGRLGAGDSRADQNITQYIKHF